MAEVEGIDGKQSMTGEFDLIRIDKLGENVNEQNENGNTALHLAISSNADIGILRSLMNKGAQLNITNNDGHTPLECLQHGSWKTALSLLKLEKQFDFRDNNGGMFLHSLMDRLGDNIWGIVRPDDIEVGHIGHVEQDELIGLFWEGILSEIQEYQIDLNLQDNFGNTPLHIAANFWPSSKNLDVMLTHFDNIDPFIRDCSGNSFLHVYLTRHSVHDETEFDKRLFQGEYRNLSKHRMEKLLNTQNNEMESPLHVFVKTQDNNVNVSNLRRIIEAGSSVNLRNILGETVLHCLFRREFDADCDDADSTSNFDLYGDSNIENKIQNIQENCRFLVTRGSDINQQNNKGEPPIFLANSESVISTMIDIGADVNITNSLGQSLLISVVNKHDVNLDIIRLLLIKGVNVNLVDIHGNNVLHFVAWHGTNPDILPELNKHGVSIVPDNLGQLPCTVACNRGNNIQFKHLCRCPGELHIHREHFVLQKEIISVQELKENSKKFDAIFQRFHPFRGNIHELLHLTSFGPITFEGESDLIKSVVKDLVVAVCKKITEKHDFFSITMVDSGSVSEKTKINLPNEFDFLCIFEELGKICFIDEEKSDRDPGYAYLKLKDKHKDHACKVLFDDNGYLDTFEIRHRIYTVIDDLFLSQEIFSHPNISYVRHHFKGANCPTFHFTILWQGCMYKHLKIDIDLVPACQIVGWWPKNTMINSLYCDTQKIVDEGAVLMIQTEIDEDDNPYSKQRISAIRAEQSYIQVLPQIAIDAYLLSKIVCNSRICPCLSIPHAVFQPRDILTSYMLKTCVFHMFDPTSEYTKNKTESKSNVHNENDLHKQVIDIFNKMLQFLRAENLPSFFFPWQNVLTFNVSLDYARNNNFYCTLRIAFIKMVLEILGEIQNFSDINIEMLMELDDNSTINSDISD
ncbi:ankyrin-2-like [Mytilus edulis]|uniref:ankyrin-2-like n=1 Tax=Mytilus edulis TaxID=6550 RepID=UPI0039F00474